MIKKRLKDIGLLAAVAVLTVLIALGLKDYCKKHIAIVRDEAETVLSVQIEEDTATATTEATLSQTTQETTKKVVVPVGTTKPVEKETVPVSAYVAPPVDPEIQSRVLLDVPYINQKNSYPTGCESVSAVMALRYAGYGISVEGFIDGHLPQGRTPFVDEENNYFGDDPRVCFLGSPYSNKGWGCYHQVISKSLNEIINHKKHKVVNLTGSSFGNLCKYINEGSPVIIWATQSMSEPRQGKTWNIVDKAETFTWIAPNHCLLLVGYSNAYYYFNDPLVDKNCRYSKGVVEARFASLGRQALAIVAADPETAAAEESTETSAVETDAVSLTGETTASTTTTTTTTGSSVTASETTQAPQTTQTVSTVENTENEEESCTVNDTTS